MTSLTLTSTTTAVTLGLVETVTQSVSKNVTVYTFGDGSEELLDDGKSNHSIIVSGVDYITIIEDRGERFPLTFPIEFPEILTIWSPYMRMAAINTMMDNMENVAVTGFEDTNFNTDYIITDFNFEQKSGEGAIPLYHYNITLEKIRDDV